MSCVCCCVLAAVHKECRPGALSVGNAMTDSSTSLLLLYFTRWRAGVLSLALPISVLGTNFTAAWLDAREAGRRRAVRPSPALSALEERLATHATNTGAFASWPHARCDELA